MIPFADYSARVEQHIEASLGPPVEVIATRESSVGF